MSASTISSTMTTTTTHPFFSTQVKKPLPKVEKAPVAAGAGVAKPVSEITTLTVALERLGRATARELAKAVGMEKHRVNQLLYGNPHFFGEVDKKKEAPVWATLATIHSELEDEDSDEEEDALVFDLDDIGMRCWEHPEEGWATECDKDRISSAFQELIEAHPKFEGWKERCEGGCGADEEHCDCPTDDEDSDEEEDVLEWARRTRNERLNPKGLEVGECRECGDHIEIPIGTDQICGSCECVEEA